MKHLDVKNPFNPSSPEYLAYQRAYALSRTYSSGKNAMCGRVLGYMLLEVQLPLGRSKVASEINSCNGDQKLVDLGMFYIDHFLRACEYITMMSINMTLHTPTSSLRQGTHARTV